MFTNNGKNVKFAFILMVSLVMIFVLCACGETEEAPKATATVQVSVKPTGTATTTATAAPTETSAVSDATGESTIAPTEGAPTGEPLLTPTGMPTVDETDAPEPTNGTNLEVEKPVITTKYVVRRDFTDYVSEVHASDDLEEAKLFADMNAHTGYSVYDASGNVIYSKNSQKVTELLKACRKISDKLIVDGFKLGVAPANPAFDDSAKLIAADTFVGWVLYESGYRGGQSEDTGLVFNEPGSHGNLVDFCIANGLTKITNIDEIKTGDIVFYSKTDENATYPDSVCIVASDLFEDDSQYLYDLSNVEDLSEMQPMRQPLPDFMFAYRIK